MSFDFCHYGNFLHICFLEFFCPLYNLTKHSRRQPKGQKLHYSKTYQFWQRYIFAPKPETFLQKRATIAITFSKTTNTKINIYCFHLTTLDILTFCHYYGRLLAKTLPQRFTPVIWDNSCENRPVKWFCRSHTKELTYSLWPKQQKYQINQSKINQNDITPRDGNRHRRRERRGGNRREKTIDYDHDRWDRTRLGACESPWLSGSQRLS